MNEIVNKSFVAGDKLIVLVDHLRETKKEFKSLKRQEIQEIFTKMN